MPEVPLEVRDLADGIVVPLEQAALTVSRRVVPAAREV